MKDTELNEAVTKNDLLNAHLHDVEKVKEATVLEEENTQLKVPIKNDCLFMKYNILLIY